MDPHLQSNFRHRQNEYHHRDFAVRMERKHVQEYFQARQMDI